MLMNLGLAAWWPFRPSWRSPHFPETEETLQGAIPAAESRAPISKGAGEDPDLVSKREVLQSQLALRPKG
jgi:hypothetical protein